MISDQTKQRAATLREAITGGDEPAVIEAGLALREQLLVDFGTMGEVESRAKEIEGALAKYFRDPEVLKRAARTVAAESHPFDQLAQVPSRPELRLYPAPAGNRLLQVSEKLNGQPPTA